MNYIVEDFVIERFSAFLKMVEDDILNDSCLNEDAILKEVSLFRHYFKALAQGGNNEF